MDTGETTGFPYQKASFILFLVAWAINVALLFLSENTRAGTGIPEALLLLASVASTLLILARRLPVQNVVMTAVLLGLLSSVVVAIGALSGIPFGPYVYSDGMGERIGSTLPWAVPLVWIVVIVNARGLARLIMRPWRQTRYYGFWVIGLAALAAVLLELSLEPFATKVKSYWAWQAPDWVWTWYSAPWTNFLSWFLCTVFLLFITTPWLINKNPIKQPMDYHPLVLWMLANVWLITGNLLHGLWLAGAAGIIGNTILAIFTIRGALWKKSAQS